jgi:hypothetical protein
MNVRITKETVMSGRGGYPSIGYRAMLVDADTGATVARTGVTVGPYDCWRARGEKLAKRRGLTVVL